MIRTLSVILTTVLTVSALSSCRDKAPLSVEVVRSEMQRNPTAAYIDGLEGKLKWNYTTGLELKAFLDVYEMPGQGRHDNRRTTRDNRRFLPWENGG